MKTVTAQEPAGFTTDPLFLGATRPPMRWGVTYSALIFNLVFTLTVRMRSPDRGR